MYSTLIALAAAGLVSASPLIPRQTNSTGAGAGAVCRDFYVDVTASASNINLASVLGGPPANQQALVQSSINQFAAGSTIQAQIAAALKTNVSGTYSLWFQYCAPASGNVSGIFQTHHGLVGNAGYWNVRLPSGDNSLSFADAAARAGWATLSYDRLGVGRSAHPDGLAVVQIAFEAAQSVSIAQSLRAGNFSNLGRFNKIVGVGHSYGSNLLTGVASTAPTAFDALVLTGFSNNVTSGPLGLAGFDSTIASVAYPARFGSLNNSYVSTPSVSIDQQEFFHYPNYTQEALDFFTANKGEYTLGQQNSISATIPLSRANFNRPVLVVTGNNDAPYCAANCSVTSLGNNQTQVDTAKALYPNVTNFATYVVPDTAHGINFHTTANLAYQRIVQFASSI